MSRVTLTGEFERIGGGTATGTVKITPSRSPILDADGKVIISGPETFDLDADGKLVAKGGGPVTLPASDDPTLGPPFTYRFDVNLTHASWKILAAWFPYGTSTVDLTKVMEVTPPDGTPTRTVALPAGGVDGQVLVWDGAGFSWDFPPKGPPITVTAGEVQTLPADAPATAEITGGPLDYALNLGLPQGGQGVPGPPVSLTAGDVQTLPPGTPATASVTGGPRDLTLNLGLPQGVPGEVTLAQLGAAIATRVGGVTGTGRPDAPSTTPYTATQLAALPSGTKYISTDGPQGAWEWQKRGTTWTATEGDTGWRTLSPGGWTVGTLQLRRVGATVSLRVGNLESIGGSEPQIPEGFRPSGSTRWLTQAAYSGNSSSQSTLLLMVYRTLRIVGTITETLWATVPGEFTWATTEPWPTTQPGIPSPA